MFCRKNFIRTVFIRNPYRFYSDQNVKINKINKILIANRGEIACRIVKSARKLGIKTVAIYSDADRNSLHVTSADEAYRIGPAPPLESYLRTKTILDIILRSNAEAVHPGYGFLSENVEFAEECEKRGITFIGPPATAIRDMGIKSISKSIMSKADVPIIPGYHDKDQSIEKLQEEAEKIGFPLMIKAVRGGGGKGMRIANNPLQFRESLESARSEARKAFGNDDVLLERYVKDPRHIEVQVFADQQGNAVHLYERDCSLQRRHQKIIEEAPAPNIDNATREELGKAAVKAAKAVGYVGAGTVEFIYDRTENRFYFMEMNTRLQVEHAITEMITGVDLVEWQIRIASGERLPLNQDQLKSSGHSFEARIYAENPKENFMPDTGVISLLTLPEQSNNVRVDIGVRENDEVSVHYDPMIGKLIVWGADRNDALVQLQKNLLDVKIAGVETNINFLLSVIKNPEFIKANISTNFIDDNRSTLFRTKLRNNELLIKAIAVILTNEDLKTIENALENRNQYNPFVIESAFRVNYQLQRKLQLKYDDKDYSVQVKFISANDYLISIDNGNTWIPVKANLLKTESEKPKISIDIEGHQSIADFYIKNNVVDIFDQNGKTQFIVEERDYSQIEDEDDNLLSSNKAVSPMPGILEKILVKKGDTVAKDDPLFVLIAMKMELVVKATRNAIITDVLYNVGDSVAKDATIVQFENDE